MQRRSLGVFRASDVLKSKWNQLNQNSYKNPADNISAPAGSGDRVSIMGEHMKAPKKQSLGALLFFVDDRIPSTLHFTLYTPAKPATGGDRVHIRSLA